jgi:HPt (histidine-containing phosphotransfer) domain-containing protein
MDPILDLQIVDSIKAVSHDDSFASELYQLFVDQSTAVLKELDQAVQLQDLVATRRLAHRLKGSAANVGAAALSRKASLIETAIAQSRSDELPLEQAASDLRELLGQTQTQLLSMSLLNS